MAADEPAPPPVPYASTATAATEPRATAALVKDVVGGTQMLVRKELELARLELMEGVSAKAQAAGAGGAAGVLGLYVVGFLGLAAAYGLSEAIATWLAFLIVAGVFLVLLGGLLLFARARATSAPLAPNKTRERIQEDVAWAKTLLRR